MPRCRPPLLPAFLTRPGRWPICCPVRWDQRIRDGRLRAVVDTRFVRIARSDLDT